MKHAHSEVIVVLRLLVPKAFVQELQPDVLGLHGGTEFAHEHQLFTLTQQQQTQVKAHAMRPLTTQQRTRWANTCAANCTPMLHIIDTAKADCTMIQLEFGLSARTTMKMLPATMPISRP